MDKPRRFIHYEKPEYEKYQRSSYHDPEWKLVKPGQVVVGRLALSTLLFVLVSIFVTLLLAVPLFWVGALGVIVMIPLFLVLGAFALWLIFLVFQALARFIVKNSEWRGPR